MKEKIRETLKILKGIYYGSIILNIYCLIGLCGFIWPIIETEGEYIFECMCILSTLVCIPLGLWLFQFKFAKKIKEKPLVEALESYLKLNQIRLFLVILPIIWGATFSFMTMSNKTYLFCACMAFIATFFCAPSEKRMKNELDLPEEIND